MGDTRPRAGGADESPRDPKAPRLDLLAAVAAGSGLAGLGKPPLDLLAAVAGLGDGEAPPLEVSNLREEGAEGIGNNNMCAHVPTHSAHKEILSSALLSEDAGTCDGCRREGSGKCRTENSMILVCLECGRHFCSGLGEADHPFGHSRQHAKQKQHWVAALFDEPEKGYCFKCNVEVDVTPEEVQMMGNVEAGGHAFGLPDLASDFIRGLPNLGDTWYGHGFGLANGQGYAIRGIPNRGNTCYMNAMVQCLLVLDKLRARMLGPDAPKGLAAMTLGELFVETSSAGGMLDPDKLLTYVRSHDQTYEGGMHDSYQLLGSLRDALNEDEEKYKNLNGQNGAPTVINSIFGFELSETRTCKCCLSNSVSHPFFYDLSLALPSKGYPAKNAASPQTSESLKSQPENIAIQLFRENEQTSSEKIQTVAESDDSHLLGSELEDVVVEETPEPLEVDSTEAPRICQSKDVVQGSFQTKEDKASCSKLSRGIFDVPVKSIRFIPPKVSDVQVEEMNEITDSIASIEECLSLFFEEVVQRRCDRCYKAYKELSTNQSKNGEQMVADTNENTTVDGDQAEQSGITTCQNEQSSGWNSLSVECKSSSSRQPHGSDAQSQIIQTLDRIADGTNLGISCGEKDSAACSTTNRGHECHEGMTEAVSSCLPAEKQINMFRDQQSEDVSVQIKMYQDRRKQTGQDHSAYQLNDNMNEQKDMNRDAIQKRLFNKLPPVLTLHLKRTDNFERKISGQVRYKEYLDVRPFMDPSSVDKDNSIYRLVGVVEHRGTGSAKTGHYIAYVRARRLGNDQHQSSCSHSWFRANDDIISKVSLEQVLECEAYILFYERMEG